MAYHKNLVGHYKAKMLTLGEDLGDESGVFGHLIFAKRRGSVCS